VEKVKFMFFYLQYFKDHIFFIAMIALLFGLPLAMFFNYPNELSLHFLV